VAVQMPVRTRRLLLALETNVTCPSCAHEFSLEEGFAKKAFEQLEDATTREISALRESERADVERRAQQLAGERARSAQQESDALKKLLKEQAEAHASALTQVRALAEKSLAPRIEEMQKAIDEREGQLAGLRAREESLASREKDLEAQVNATAIARAREMVTTDRQTFERQLAERDAQVAVLREEQLELRKEREQLKDEKSALALEVRKQVDAQIQHRESVIRTQEQERAQLEKAELQKKLDDAGEQLAAAQRKMDQGSQQLQGEVLELAIEDALRRAFPLDTVEEVKKGQRGGDILQHVTTRTGQPAGAILWETKRAKDWSPQWVTKLKEDMRASNAVVGILVTMPGALPKDWPDAAYFDLYQDIWVTQASCALGVAQALRASLLDLQRLRTASAGKGEKMEAMYDYLTSAQFAQKLKAVYDTFTRMREELESEKNTTMQRWARREKQLQGGMTQLLSIGGEIQGLAQQELPMLEMEPQRDMQV
jgi:hypothetical protein